MANYIAELDGGRLGDTAITARTIKQAWKEAVVWAQEGDWPDEGCRVSLRVSSTRKSIEKQITIEPDHAALIEEAGGDSECDHQWTSEGEGGCDSNPGVWSLGGTKYEYHAHCSLCGLRRVEINHGSQRHPDEANTVRYFRSES